MKVTLNGRDASHANRDQSLTQLRKGEVAQLLVLTAHQSEERVLSVELSPVPVPVPVGREVVDDCYRVVALSSCE